MLFDYTYFRTVDFFNREFNDFESCKKYDSDRYLKQCKSQDHLFSFRMYSCCILRLEIDVWKTIIDVKDYKKLDYKSLKINYLKTKIMSVQITNKDIVLLGHGSYEGGAKNKKLPNNIDLYLLPPIGYTLKTDVAAAMIHQDQIAKIVLHHATGGTEVVDPPMAVYKGGDLAPDLKLYNLGTLSDWGKKTIGDKKNVVTVDKDILLSELILTNDKIKEAVKKLLPGEKLKLYWSACANQVSGNYASLT
ncbi:hypothetical protein BJQ96_01827 [Flavobacterium sp. PL0002]|nr:hypothetical protein [Flavobacterium sp. PL002]